MAQSQSQSHMEEDDEFGDLYTDVLAASFQTDAPKGEGEKIRLNSNALVEEKTLAEPSMGDDDDDASDFKFNLSTESLLSLPRTKTLFGARVLECVKTPQTTINLMYADDDDDDDIDIVVVEERDDNRDHEFVDIIDSKEEEENTVNFMNASQNHQRSSFQDEWESDSEDDLQIVLNDNHQVMEGIPGDEGEPPLVIVADNGDVLHHHHHHDWPGNEEADGERKELGDVPGAGGLGTAAQPRTGFANQPYHHHQSHSQFKYVRPGAAPIPGTAPVTQGASQVRPLVPIGPLGGRGRGDWRPTGLKGAVPMQKGFSPNYGVAGWGVNSAGRGYGSGLDFTLPSHKTIFEVDIDCFEEKPWKKLPGIEVSDFFNFGLNEESWKDYRRQLEQLRLETSMQSKIRVYESGRAEQDYDPDLPPELAAAAGIQEIPSESANPGKTDAGSIELARASAHGRPLPPTGRPIPVEIGSGDRLPSSDTRRPRMHDIDAIIEVICHSSKDDEDMSDQQDIDPAGEDVEGIDEIDHLKEDDGANRHIAHAYRGPRKEVFAKRTHLKNTVRDDEILTEDALHFPSADSMRYQPDEETGISQEARSAKRRTRIRSPKMTASGEKRGEEITDDQRKESFDSGNDMQSPPSSARTVVSDGEQTAEVDGINDESLMVDRSSDVEREEKAEDERSRDTFEVENLVRSAKVRKPSSHEKPLSLEKDEGEDLKAAWSSENSKARSGSGTDDHKFRDSVEDELLQSKPPLRTGDVKRLVEDEDYARRSGRHERDETGRNDISVKGMAESTSHRVGDPNSSLHRYMKRKSPDWRKESDLSEGSLHWRDGNHHVRRNRFDDARNTEHCGEIGPRILGNVRESERTEKEQHHKARNQLDSGGWRATNHEQNIVSRQRDRTYNLKSLSEKIDVQSKNRKEGAPISWKNAANVGVSHTHKENRRRRERDGPDQWNRDDPARLEKDDLHYVRQKEEGLFRKEMNDWQKDRNEWNSLKQCREEFSLRKERGETRSVMRNGCNEDKAWSSHSRGKDEYRGSSREYHPKESGRHSDQLKRRNRVENESFLQQRGHEDLFARGNQLKYDGKRPRNGRLRTRNELSSHADETSEVHEDKQKEGSRKEDSHSVDHDFLVPSKRNQEKHGGQISHMVNSRGRIQQRSGENEIHVNRQPVKKAKEEASSDDEHPNSKKGRSKLERWTSHKDNDFSIMPMSSSSIKRKDLNTFASNEASSVAGLSEDPSKKKEDKLHLLADNKDTSADISNIKPKVVEDKHLDTVTKLKKRSERFKLPLPREKDSSAVNKIEIEPTQSAQTEIPQDSEIKSERPARKRRWTGS